MQTILRNVRIFTGTDLVQGNAENSCLIINDDLIEHIGTVSDDEVKVAVQDGVRVLDLKSHVVAPSFIDGHMHLLMFGQSLKKVALDKCRTLEDIRHTIKAAAEIDQDAPRLLCRGWMHFMTDGKALATDLDDLDAKGRPIFIDSKDLHSSWCNSAALMELGVSGMPDPEGGIIHRDGNGIATGLLSEAAAVTLVWPHIAKSATREQKKSAIRDAIKVYNAAGYTGMIEMAMDENALKALLELRSQEQLTIRLAMHWLISPSATTEENLRQVDRAIELSKQYHIDSSPDFRIVGIKIIGDGVIDACTAALLEPYSSNSISCDPIWAPDKLQEVVRKADAAGLQCALHAIGDATVRMCIDALASLDSSGRRHRIEHLELTSAGDAIRLRDLGITASIQPVHADPAILREWTKLLGPERRNRAFAYREFLDQGVTLALGSDAPTAPNLPLPNLYVATTRRSAREARSNEVVNKHFALPLLNAFSAATLGAAYSCFADHRVGRIMVGMKADFVVLDMQWEAEKLLEAKVLQTWFDGIKVYDVDEVV